MAESTGKSVRVRMAPSPTGLLHIGTARAALYNWLFARHYGGTFIVRIEDTDKERSLKTYETGILEGFLWLGIDWDEGPAYTPGDDSLLYEGDKGEFGPYRQSERTIKYRSSLEQLLTAGHAYYCYCTTEELETLRQGMLAQGLQPKYNGRCRDLTSAPEGKSPQVIRFKTPETKVQFKDMIRGEVTFDAALFGDMVIAKDLDTPLYNFAVVVDDELMKITHVIRGEDHLSNTPKQILLLKALGFSQPTYAHLPLILNTDRSKMSKRFNDVALTSYRERGYLPEALDNFLAFLGWHPKDDKEIMSLEELAKEFDIERVQQAGAVFSEEKLDWLNREYMKKMSPKELAALALPFFQKKDIAVTDSDLLERVVAVQAPRAKTLDDLAEQSRFFFALPNYESALLVWKETPASTIKTNLENVLAALTAMPPEDFIHATLAAAMPGIIGEQSRGAVLWPLRVALSGQSTSPDPVEIMDLLGKHATLTRITAAIEKL